MKVVEAKFYPRTKADGGCVSLARVSCLADGAVLELVEIAHHEVAPFRPSDLRRELEFRIQTAFPQIFETLTDLRSEYWEFVEVVVN